MWLEFSLSPMLVSGGGGGGGGGRFLFLLNQFLSIVAYLSYF